MKFVIMGMEPRGEWARLDADEMNRRVRNHQQRLDELAMARIQTGPPGLIFASFGLGEEREVVTVKRERGRHACIDGPFPETKEVIGGFDIVEFASRQDAIEWTTAMQRHPSHVSEIRPLRELWWVSGTVDPVRIPSYERRPVMPAAAKAQSEVFMLTSIADKHADARRPESERKQIEAEQQLVGAEYVRGRSTLTQESGMWLGARLSASAEATTVRWTGGPAVSEGPFADTNEVISSFNVMACASQEEAVTWAHKLATRDGAAIEIRPVRGCWWIYRE